MLTDGDLQALWLTVRLAGLVTLILLVVAPRRAGRGR